MVPPDHKYGKTYFVLCSAALSFALVQTLVNPVLTTIQKELDTDQSTVTWLLTAYLISASVFTPVIGRLGDRFGKDRMLAVALIALALGSLLAAIAPTIGVMIAARSIQGLGGGVVPLAVGIIRDEFPRRRVAGAIGAMASLLAIGTCLGLVVAGPIVEVLGFRWLFWLPMVVTLAAAVATRRWVPRSPERNPLPISYSSAVVMAIWLVAVLIAVTQGAQWGWASPVMLGLYAVAAVGLPAWVVIESRSPSPLVDMRMMRLPTVWPVNLSSFLFGIGMFALFAYLSQFLQTPPSTGYGFGISLTQTALVLASQAAATVVGGWLAGVMTRKVGAKTVLVLGTSLTALATAALTLFHHSLVHITIELVVLGIAFGFAYAAMSDLIVNGVPRSHTGVASGMNANIRTIGGAVGSATLASLITSTSANGGLPAESGYTSSFALLAVTSALAAVAAMLVPGRRGSQEIQNT